MIRLIIVSLVLLAVTIPLTYAQTSFSPYGSVRVGMWYENEDEDWSLTGESTLNLNYYLQGNSRFGAKFSDGDKQGRVEFGGTGSIRHLWGSYNMGTYTILIGHTETLLTQKGSMNFGSENNFVGWGAVDNSRRPQVRFDLDNGVSLAFVQPRLTNVAGIDQAKTVLLPKLNLGYKGKIGDNMSLNGALGVNMYNYDDNDGHHDETVMSYVLGMLLDMDLDPMTVTLHGNFGQNTGNYGLGSQTHNIAIWNGADEEIVDVTTLGGFGELAYKMNNEMKLTLGASYTMSDCDLFDNADTAMAAFGQISYRPVSGFSITPEVGLLDKMKDKEDHAQGSLLYFGTQLRMDF